MAGKTFSATSSIGQWLQNTMSDIGTKIDGFFASEYQTGVGMFQNLVDGTGKILGAYLTVWIMIEGYKILWGGSKQSMTNFMWDSALKIIFIAIAFNSGAWISLVYNAFDGMKEYGKEIFAEDGNVYEKLGMWAGMLGDYYTEVWEKADFLELAVFIFVIILAFIGFFIGAFPVMRHLIINTLSFLLLMIVAPLAFYFLIFKVTKNAFSQWLQMVLANIMTIIMLNFFVAMIFKYIFEKLFSNTAYYDNAFTIMLLSIFYGILLNIFCSMAVQFAQQLTNVSLEGIAGSSMGRAMGIAGSAAGMAIVTPFATAKLGAAGANLIGKGASAVGKGVSAAANSGVGKFAGGLTKNLAKDGMSMAANSTPGKAVTGAASSVANSIMNSGPVKTASSAMSKAKDIAGKINDYAKK
ncbi:type IV secretion system protein [Campylobacter sp.]|uniref:type IV secretion system protein n=1 Tax=Campylobacter sp. TaxID=205 RepID=UPI002A755664|nr:type IV secretion system protein [Campylobacter sp.]MDY3246357.1 type IV secretion system protein [Campylobacter sp.]MDY4803774.1 type IV secretion system protein [Campylobacter sp.]